MPARYIIAIITLLLTIGLALPSAAQKNRQQVSGTIVNGLRLLTLSQNPADNAFTVYRGDYIQPTLVGVSSFEMVIAQLDVRKTFPVTDDSKPYIKMKKPGHYSFTAGSVSGTIDVIPYSATHYTELTAAETVKIIDNIQPLLLDVRTPGEYQQAHIKGATLIPVQVLQQQLAVLKDYKEKEIIIYCASGNRSTVASRILIENGFEKIYNVRYGINDWVRKGYPVERSK